MDKNHNPRKGTETCLLGINIPFNRLTIRTIIPARGRKQPVNFPSPHHDGIDKNHNPRKGTETMRI